MVLFLTHCASKRKTRRRSRARAWWLAPSTLALHASRSMGAILSSNKLFRQKEGECESCFVRSWEMKGKETVEIKKKTKRPPSPVFSPSLMPFRRVPLQRRHHFGVFRPAGRPGRVQVDGLFVVDGRVGRWARLVQAHARNRDRVDGGKDVGVVDLALGQRQRVGFGVVVDDGQEAERKMEVCWCDFFFSTTTQALTQTNKQNSPAQVGEFFHDVARHHLCGGKRTES